MLQAANNEGNAINVNTIAERRLPNKAFDMEY